jgi:hypothetical protein
VGQHFFTAFVLYSHCLLHLPGFNTQTYEAASASSLPSPNLLNTIHIATLVVIRTCRESECKASSTPVAQFFLLESFGGNAGM